MPPRDYIRYIHDEEFPLRVRVEFETDRRNNMTRFTVQLEVEIDGRWLPVVRYDTEHNQAHVDLLDPDGREYDKQWLGAVAPYNLTFTSVETELSTDYHRHLRRFIEQMRRKSQ